MATEEKREKRRVGVRWGWAVGGIVLLYVVMIAAVFGWVAFYSHVLRPGQTLEIYQAYARAASPIVSAVVGVPAFFAAGVWLRKRLGSAGFPTAAAVAALMVLVEIAFLFSARPEERYSVWIFLANVPTKAGAVLLGARPRSRLGRVGRTDVAA